MVNEELLRIAQEEYLRQLQEYLTNPVKKPNPTIIELIKKYLQEEKLINQEVYIDTKT